MSMKDDARRDMGTYGEFASDCEHGRTSYCFDCVRKRHNQELLDGKYDDVDGDYASTPHPSAHYDHPFDGVEPGLGRVTYFGSDDE